MTDQPTPQDRAQELPAAEAAPREQLPLGHSESAHRRIGWCSQCRARTVELEVAVWRAWAINLLHLTDKGRASGG